MSFDANEWNKATANGAEEPPPDGIYNVEILMADTFMSKKGQAFAKITYRVLDGPHTGVCWPQIGGLEGQAAGFTKGNLFVLGFDTATPISSLEELGNLMGQALVGVVATVKVSTSQQGYTNTDVVRAISGKPDIPIPSNGSSAGAAAPVVDEDGDVIPF